VLFRLGLLDLETRDWRGMTYAGFLDRHLPAGAGGLVARLARALSLPEDHEIISRLEWLGLLSDRPVPDGAASSLDVLCTRLQQKLRFSEGEHDMVILEHHFITERADGRLRRLITRMQVFGLAGDDSALARTVSYPAALACRLILDGRVKLAGVRIPVEPQLTEPILLGLDERGIHLEEDWPAALPA
jgi:saccharopine dehydrogenase-like NADP-dependent oxidoreductase